MILKNNEWTPTYCDLPPLKDGQSDPVLTIDSAGVQRVLYTDGSQWFRVNGKRHFISKFFPITYWRDLPEPPSALSDPSMGPPVMGVYCIKGQMPPIMISSAKGWIPVTESTPMDGEGVYVKVLLHDGQTIVCPVQFFRHFDKCGSNCWCFRGPSYASLDIAEIIEWSRYGPEVR